LGCHAVAPRVLPCARYVVLVGGESRRIFPSAGSYSKCESRESSVSHSAEWVVTAHSPRRERRARGEGDRRPAKPRRLHVATPDRPWEGRHAHAVSGTCLEPRGASRAPVRRIGLVLAAVPNRVRMMSALSAQELAALVPCPVEYVDRLHALGLLEPHEGKGAFDSSDVHLVRLMFAFEDAGVALDDGARGVAAGQLIFPFRYFMPEPKQFSETFEELALRLDRSPEFLRRLSVEFGLPPADGDLVREEDAEMLAQMVTTLALVDEDDLSRL